MTRGRTLLAAPLLALALAACPRGERAPRPEEAPPAADQGFISGSLGYPSEEIPAEMQICAEPLGGGERVCTDKHQLGAGYKYGLGYRLAVPAGTYHVYAFVPGERHGGDEDYRAYYNDFVTCGLNAECPSHMPLPVAVAAGQTASGIDPIDWYEP
jgi:hypothetical protein